MLRQFLHITLTLLLLASSWGVTIKKHYCLGEFRYASLNIWSLPCCSDDPEQLPPCCSDEYERFQLEDEFQGPSGPQLNLPETVAIPLLPVSESLLSEAFDLTFPPFHNYKPPLLYENRRVQFQSFLI